MGSMTAEQMLADPARMSEARAAAYGLLGGLVDDGITDETLELAAASPRLAPLIAARSRDRLAADHCHVFDLAAPPFEGLIVDAEARVGGAASMRLRQTLAAIDARVDVDVEPEHLGAQLGILSRLSAREASAHPHQRQRARRSSALVLDRHLLRWALPYEAAVSRCGRALPTALVGEIVDLALHHRADLRDGQPAELALAPEDPAAVDLDDPDTDLRAIASFLIRPAASGLVLTRSDITDLGRRLRVPRGFGDRSLMLFHLLRNAAGLDELGGVTRALDRIAAGQANHLRDRVAPYGGQLDHLVDPWLGKLAVTRDVLGRIEAEAPS